MAAKYYTILTTVGKAKVANAAALGRQIKLTQIAVGDGGGQEYEPTEAQTALRGETYRSPISHLGTDAQNPNWVTAEGMIPVDVGSWFVREVGIFDEDGDLFAIGKYPETYKPTLSEGTGRDLYIRFIMVVSDIESIEIKVDPTVEIATRTYVKDKLVNVPTISFIFDDGTSDHMDVGAQFLARGFRAGFAINAPQYIDVSGRLSRANIRYLYDAGHEILNHGATHKKLSKSEHDPVMVRAEINTCYDALNSLGIPVYGWVSPYSTTHKDYHYILSERHAYACTVYGPEDGSLDVRTDPMMLSRYNLDSGDVDKFKAMIDSMIANRKHVCIYAHKVTDSVPLTPAVLAEMLDYCKSKVDSGELSVITTAQQVRTVTGTSNQGFMQICEAIETGAELWKASKGNTVIDKPDLDTVIATTDVSDSLIWQVHPDQTRLVDYQPITFSTEILANDVTLSIGMHFYNSDGELISGKSFETGAMTIEKGKHRRYSLHLTVPPGASQIRPYLRLPDNITVTLNKPRLKIGNDCSDVGRKKSVATSVIHTKREKLLLPEQIWANGGVDTRIKLPSFSNEFLVVNNGSSIKALKDIQVALNLYGFWTSASSVPTGIGMILMNNPSANSSRHAAGNLILRQGEGGVFSHSTTVNLAKGQAIEFDVRHYCDGYIEIPESNPLFALDVLVTQILS